MTSDGTHAPAFWGRGPPRSVLLAAPVVLLAAALPSSGLEALVFPFLISYAAITPFVFVLRPRPVTFALGAVVVAAIAGVVEIEASGLAGPMSSGGLVLILVAPVVEELLKFGASAGTGATYRTAAGAGLGFAATENGIYYLAAWGDPTLTLAVLVLVRSITDPLVHVDGATLTTSSYRGSTLGLPAGIVLHASWNALTLVLLEMPAAAALGIFLVASVGLAALLRLLYRSRETSEALAGSEPAFSWSKVAG